MGSTLNPSDVSDKRLPSEKTSTRTSPVSLNSSGMISFSHYSHRGTSIRSSRTCRVLCCRYTRHTTCWSGRRAWRVHSRQPATRESYAMGHLNSIREVPRRTASVAWVEVGWLMLGSVTTRRHVSCRALGSTRSVGVLIACSVEGRTREGILDK